MTEASLVDGMLQTLLVVERAVLHAVGRVDDTTRKTAGSVMVASR